MATIRGQCLFEIGFYNFGGSSLTLGEWLATICTSIDKKVTKFIELDVVML